MNITFEISRQASNFTATLTYNPSGDLIAVEITCERVRPYEDIEWIAHTCRNTNLLKEAVKSTGLTLTERKQAISFDTFWQSYNLKRDRKTCEELWERLTPIERLKAYNAIERYNNEIILDQVPKKHPKSFLRQKKWLDYEN